MKITNKLNLPESIYNSVIKHQHPINEDFYSVTEILGSIKEILLKRRHYSELECDISDLIPAMFGSAVHKIFEENTNEGNAELKLEYGKLRGICDLWKDDVLEDYKTTSVNKVIRKDFEEHRKQLLIYAWMIFKIYDKRINTIKINYLMKDWSKIQSVTRTDYPKSPIFIYVEKINDSDYDYIESFIKEKIELLEQYKNIPDNLLPECSNEEKWYTGDKFAVYKNIGDAKAKKVFNSKEEADIYADENKCSYVEYRPGDYLKCMYYCNLCKGEKK